MPNLLKDQYYSRAFTERLADVVQQCGRKGVSGAVIIAGIGRFGQIVNRLVQSSGFKTVVLDHDMETIQLMPVVY